MEEYLQNLRSLRSQMNDIEEASAKRLVEEHQQKTAIESLLRDILSVTSEATRLNAESKDLEKENAQICYQIIEKQSKISSLENETSTLSQSLELLRQQTVSASAGLEDKRLNFSKITEDIVLKLQKGHDWLNSYKQKVVIGNLVEEYSSKHLNLLGDTVFLRAADSSVGTSSDMNLENMRDNMNMNCKKLIAQVQSKKTEYEKLEARQSQLHDENAKSKLLVLQLEQKIETFTPALKALDIESLEEELKALLTDAAGELEYLKSLKDQVKQVKGVSHAVKCQCGEEYMVEMESGNFPGQNRQDW